MKLLVSLCGLLAVAGNCLAQDEGALDAVPLAYSHKGWFMGSVLVAKGDQVLLSRGYGWADAATKSPDDPETVFRLGSLTKQFTAAAVLLLEEKGRLSVDDLVKKHLPGAPAAWDKITIRNLLTHTSGIPNYTGFPDYNEFKLHATTPEQLVARFRDKPLEFEPGSRESYSNSGYALLGLLIERISGTTYADFIRTQIFKPLDMSDSGCELSGVVVPRMAVGYQPGPDGPRPADPVDMSVPFSAGALYSTTLDLLKWNRGLFGGKLLSAASLEEMTTPFKKNYAFGIGVGNMGGAKFFAHAGGVDGFSSFLVYFPDEQLTIAVLSNLASGQSDKIALALAGLLHGAPVDLPRDRKAIALPAGTLEKFVGTYDVSPQMTLNVTVVGGKLKVEAPGQPPFVFEAESEKSFFMEAADVQIEFQTDDGGAVTGLVLVMSGHKQLAKRM